MSSVHKQAAYPTNTCPLHKAVLASGVPFSLAADRVRIYSSQYTNIHFLLRGSPPLAMKREKLMLPAVALDFETSDKDPACACALGMVRIENGTVADTLYRLIRPPKKQIHFSDIHGLYWNDLCDAPTFAELWPEFANFMRGARLFIAHNASFDRRVLRACCMASGVQVPDAPFACTVKGSRLGLPQLPHHKLNDVCSHLGFALEHHKAWSDALAAARIYLWLRQSAGLADEQMMLKK